VNSHATVMSAVILGPEEGRIVDSPTAGRMSYKVRGAQTGGTVTVLEAVAPRGGPPLHRHTDADEFIYVLEGQLRGRLDEQLLDAPAGSFVFIPKGLAHTWQNASDGPARFLGVFAPASPGMEEFFERAAELPAETRLAEGFGRFAADAGIEVLGPPLAQPHPIAQATVPSGKSA
jgi:quercetin dioxygenase-like cupin family protein